MKTATRSRLGLGLIGGGLALSFAHHIRFAGTFADSRPAIAATFIPSVLALVAALWVGKAHRSNTIPEEPFGRVAVWYLGGALLFALAVYVSISATFGRPGLTPEAWFTVGNWAIAGSALGLVMANYDLRRAEALEQARVNEQRATQLTQRLSVLNRVLRHDVRNKLTIILGYANDGTDSGIDSAGADAIVEAAESLETIVERVRRLRNLVENETPEMLDLSSRVAEIVEAFQREYPTARITVRSDEAVAAYAYPYFPTLLEELLENAIVHNPRPEAECRVEVALREVTTPSGEMSEIVVEDNGPGIPEREQMVQTDDVETQVDHSRGTSLWLARWIVDASGGDFAIETPDSGGSRLRIRLPQSAAR